MAGSSSNPCVVAKVVEEYQYQFPYPSHVFVANFVTVKLSSREIYGVWKIQMLCLLRSHEMLGFINGTFERPPQNSVLGKEKVGDYILWERSDALVKGWILGSLSEQTLRYVVNLAKTNEDITAKDVWDKLQTIYDPPALLRQQTVLVDKEEKNRITRETNPIKEGNSISEDAQSKDRDIKQQKDCLYRAILRGRWEHVDTILKEGKVTMTDKIAINGNTGLHVVVGTTKKKEVLQKILNLAAKDSPLLDMKNSEGSTLLHVASIVGNTEAAKILVVKNQDLLKAKDNDGDTPLKKALSNMHTEKVLSMLNHNNAKDIEMDSILKGTSGEELMVNTISSKDFASAHKLVINRCETMNSDAVLMAMAQNFPSRPHIIESIVYKLIKATQTEEINIKYFLRNCQRSYQENINFLSQTCCVGLPLLDYACTGIYWLFMAITCILVWPFKFIEVKVKRYFDAVHLLLKLCNLINDNDKLHQSNSVHQYYTNPIFEATRQNAHEVVENIVTYFPNAIWSTNEDGHNIIQYAVINRSEKVYNLLYQMSEHKNIYKTIIDSSGNNLLHLVATLAPTNKLNLISGAALQIQRELQWFQEVERFVCPLNVMQKNLFQETPQMIFTREHKELVIEGEKWMKTTAESYTITAALITTIMFAAAITVPGGNSQDTGIPIFTHNAAFSIFAVSDAISLFTSVMSLLMFLSILTARFAEQDFLLSLPTKLVIGLVTLFVSTTAMIIAFGATLFLVFGRSHSWILIPIGGLTCLPISSFVTLQLPLVWDFISSTFGRSIFGKKSDEPFY